MFEWEKEFESINNLLKFLKHQKSGSKSTEENYLRFIRDFCKYTHMHPDQLISLERSKAEKLVQDYCDSLLEKSRKRGRSVRYPNAGLTALRSFFRINGFSKQNGLELRIMCYRQPPRVRNVPEYIPELKEALRMAERAGSRKNRAIIYTLISTGLRNSTLRAVIYKDLKDELEKGQKHLLITIRPEMKSVIDSACKYDIPYYVFTSEQATQAIREYIEERIEKYGGINDSEPLFISDHNQLPRVDRRKKLLSARELQEIVHKVAKQSGIKEWKHVYPHSLRKVFERVLRSRLSDGGNLDSKDQEFFMGHILSGSQDAYYDKTKIEEMRAKYARLVFEEKPPYDSSTFAKFARILGINFDEIKMKVTKERERELTTTEEELLLEECIKNSLNNRQIEYEQKVIQEEFIETFLNENWEFVASIGSGKILVKKPKPSNNGDTVPTDKSASSALKEQPPSYDASESSTHEPSENSPYTGVDFSYLSKPKSSRSAYGPNELASGTLDDWMKDP